jgi:hypothetical protein
MATLSADAEDGFVGHEIRDEASCSRRCPSFALSLRQLSLYREIRLQVGVKILANSHGRFVVVHPHRDRTCLGMMRRDADS